jgi:hypothetical protein
MVQYCPGVKAYGISGCRRTTAKSGVRFRRSVTTAFGSWGLACSALMPH